VIGAGCKIGSFSLHGSRKEGNKMTKTAYFDPRGCDFWKDEKYISDVGNYRLVACVIVKTGEPVIIEFGGWQRKESFTKKSGKTGIKIVNDNALYINGQHEVYHERLDNQYGPDAGTYGYNFKSELGIDEKNYDYTRADLIRFMSDITGDEYTDIEFSREKVEKQIEQFYTPVEKALQAKARTERERIKAIKDAEREKRWEEIRKKKGWAK
jgi:hypothetical protein